MIRTLAGAVQDDDFFGLNLDSSAIDGFHGEPNLLDWILNSLIGYNYQKATIEDRTRFAIHLCSRFRQPRAASLVRLLLPAPDSISQMIRYKDVNGRTLLNSAAWALGEQSFMATQSSGYATTTSGLNLLLMASNMTQRMNRILFRIFCLL
jgi:hypothetical protein